MLMNMNVVDIRNKLAEAINRVAYAGERIILERRGKGVAALVSVEDLALLEELENQADIRAARKALKEKGAIPLERIKKRLGMT
jgi:prevent-host-death family protein